MEKTEFERLCASSRAWHRFHPVAGVETKHGKILIGESHRNTDPEFAGPHVQTIYAIDRDGRMDFAGQKLYFGPDSPAYRSREMRVKATEAVALQYIEDSVDSGRFQ